MILQKLVNVFAFAGAFYVSHKLGVWYDPVDTESNISQPVEIEKSKDQPVDIKNNDQNSILSEEDKRRLQRAKEDLEKKVCTKHGLCEPTPKPLSESVSEAFYDTWLALKKIPSFWARTANNIGEKICRFFSDD
ncbi:uncharacterized protein LOC110181196 [Drosophila serrata]|uniref:uncharacterized protein LOC110181196 n=1 Tax=Drosophila serrata TaxID=7274 RepID=UPI000A1D326B|nr:uncharacterized protein LOC110181196 [Drosophila serrata]